MPVFLKTGIFSTPALPWRVVRSTVALHTFLRNHKKEEVRQLQPNNVELEQDSDTESDNELEE
jgi:hypothetical protein